MRICHLCLNGPYNEGWNYQENILPKYHSKQGYEVFQIVTPYMWEGTEQILSSDKRYRNADGVEVIRCVAKKHILRNVRFNRYPEVEGLLEEIKPDILFIHDVQCLDIDVVVKFLKRHDKCVVYVDNHSDFSNSARNWISKNILHKIIWRNRAQLINPYVKKFYGVLPARVDFLKEIYKLPEEKCELLMMGADDEYVLEALQEESIESIRAEHGINKDDFLVVTGGKIDYAKAQTILLMKAIKSIENSNVKLLVFGSVAPELKDEVDALADGEKIKYIGWIQANDAYKYFAAADLVIFPGRHSVFWEQVVALGKPMVVKHWEGTTHVDCGGNTEFLYEDTEEEIKCLIEKIREPEKYEEMKKEAQNASKNFMYSVIAEKSIS